MHCKAGLGRTGVLICAYMIKHYGFTAEEAIGYIRICRPGSVIGPQQKYLISRAKQLAAEGQEFREALLVSSLQDAILRCMLVPMVCAHLDTACREPGSLPFKPVS